MLVYPLSMVMLLLSDVLRDSKSPSAESSVLAIEECVNYLRRIKQDLHCDVSKMLEGCTKMHIVAQSVVFPGHASSDVRKSSSLDDEGFHKVSSQSFPTNYPLTAPLLAPLSDIVLPYKLLATCPTLHERYAYFRERGGYGAGEGAGG